MKKLFTIGVLLLLLVATSFARAEHFEGSGEREGYTHLGKTGMAANTKTGNKYLLKRCKCSSRRHKE